MGRPLPGAAEVRIAAYDVEAGELVLGRDGLAVECGSDEIGMLMARVRPHEPLSTVPLRGVFGREDAWLQTGDLFRRDSDGDYWRIDNVAEVIHTRDRVVFAGPIRDALGDLPAVDLAVAYGVKAGESEHELAIAAVTLRADHELDGADIAAALADLPSSGRPFMVHVVERIPVTTWFRPITGPLRAAGIPDSGPGVWVLDPETGDYRPAEPAVTAAVAVTAAATTTAPPRARPRRSRRPGR